MSYCHSTLKDREFSFLHCLRALLQPAVFCSTQVAKHCKTNKQNTWCRVDSAATENFPDRDLRSFDHGVLSVCCHCCFIQHTMLQFWTSSDLGFEVGQRNFLDEYRSYPIMKGMKEKDGHFSWSLASFSVQTLNSKHKTGYHH